MEEFLGALFCGGRGTRINNLTKYISKSFLPVYNKPVFEFGLKLLTDSKYVNEIIILSNTDNDHKLRECGFRTIVQDDKEVSDMFSGWEYIKKMTGTSKHGVLIPSDNICEVNVDVLAGKFIKKKADFLFSIHSIKDVKKLSDMGIFNIEGKKYYYKDPDPRTHYGVIAPYIIRNGFNCKDCMNIFEWKGSYFLRHKGYWFDLGDYESIAEAIAWYRKKLNNQQTGL